MNAARILRNARKRADLSQRELARRAGMQQPAIARIESGDVIPRADTLDRVLEACGSDLEPSSRLGQGLDRSVIRELLKLTPGERSRLGVEEAKNVEPLLASKHG